jgi:monoamine oxidase
MKLQFTQRLWNDHGKWGMSTGSSFSDLGYQNTWEPTRAQLGTSGIINDYTGGTVSDQKRTKLPFALIGIAGVRHDATQFLRQINRSFPGLPKLWNGKASSSLPHLSPFFNCSYSFWRVGQYHTIAGYEGVRQGNVFFGGEHTSQDFQGFMEGGASEGARAAMEILDQL